MSCDIHMTIVLHIIIVRVPEVRCDGVDLLGEVFVETPSTVS